MIKSPGKEYISSGHTTSVVLRPHLSFDPLVKTSAVSICLLQQLYGEEDRYMKTASWSVKCLNVMLSIPWLLLQTTRLGVCACKTGRERVCFFLYCCIFDLIMPLTLFLYVSLCQCTCVWSGFMCMSV